MIKRWSWQDDGLWLNVTLIVGRVLGSSADRFRSQGAWNRQVSLLFEDDKQRVLAEGFLVGWYGLRDGIERAFSPLVLGRVGFPGRCTGLVSGGPSALKEGCLDGVVRQRTQVSSPRCGMESQRGPEQVAALGYGGSLG